MKSLIVAGGFMVSLLFGGVVYEGVQMHKSIELMEQLRERKQVSKYLVEEKEKNGLTVMHEPVTETFVVKSEADEGYLYAESISEKTNAPYGFILDNKYNIGDIVEVTYDDDEIYSEKLVLDK